MMPTSAEIDNIRTCLASDYAIDLSGLSNDSNTLENLVRDTSKIDSIKIYTDSSTYTNTNSNNSSAYVPDLESISYADVQPDERLIASRVEQNLDEATKHSQNCLQLRKDYSELAKLRNDTRFKAEEFFRLDSVHRKEVDAGLYKLPWQEAEDDHTALAIAITEIRKQQTIVDEMLQPNSAEHKLSDAGVAKYVNDSVKLAKYSTEHFQPEVGEGTDLTTTYRTSIEQASWKQTQASIKANLSQLAGKLATAERKELYLHKDEAFRSHRAAISRHIAYLQLHEHCRHNSPLHYQERLAADKVLFETNLICLIERAKVISTGLRDSYGIELPISPPEKGRILDTLSVWLVLAQNELTKYKRAQRLLVLSVWNQGRINIVPRGGGSPMESFELSLSVDTKQLSMKKALLRGVAFEYTGGQSRPLSLQVLPPPQAYTKIDRGGSADLLWFGRVLPVTPALELKPQHPDVFWNGLADGDWKVKGTFDQTLGSIDSLVMHLWLAAL